MSTSAIPAGTARVYGVAIILAPILLMASTVAFIADGDGINDGVMGGVFGVWSCFAFVIGLTGVLRLLEPRAPRAAPVLSVLALLGFTAGVGFNVNAMYLASHEVDFLTEASDESADGRDAFGMLAFLPWGLLVPVSLVLIGVFLWRTEVVARWSAILIAAGGVLFVSARPERIEALALVGDAVLVVGLGSIGLAILTGTRSPAAPEPAVDTADPSLVAR